MKKLVLSLIFSALFAFVALAHSVGSQVDIRMYDNGFFDLNLDGTTYAQVSRQHIDEVPAGNHFVKILRSSWDPYRQAYRSRTVYAGWLNVPASSAISAVADWQNGITIESVRPLYAEEHPYGDYQEHANDCDHHGGWDHPAGGYEHHGPSSCPTVCGPVAMDAAHFEALKASVSRAWFEDNKIIIIKEALGSQYVHAAEVRELMGMMSFESSRLDIAKFAYGRVVDPQNYYIVNDAFWFGSSITELQNYIGSIR